MHVYKLADCLNESKFLRDTHGVKRVSAAPQGLVGKKGKPLDLLRSWLVAGALDSG